MEFIIKTVGAFYRWLYEGRKRSYFSVWSDTDVDILGLSILIVTFVIVGVFFIIRYFIIK